MTVKNNAVNKMKLFLPLLFVSLIGLFSSAQEQTSGASFFGQCMLNIESDDEIRQLETEMRQNPYLKVVRLDLHTRRAFVLTNSLSSLTEEEFASWFNQHSESLFCIQIGRFGVDQMKPFPFTDCEDK